MTSLKYGSLVAALALAPAAVSSQVRASERATVSQTVDATVITINYSRPEARGRKPVFGKVVHWGEVWTPGANWATTLDVSRDVMIDGHAVKKGKYSMWFVVHEKGDWTFVLDTLVQIYHASPPDSNTEQLRWPVRPKDSDFREILTWSFPEVRPDGALLLFEWSTTRITMNVTVAPSHPLTIARADAEPFIGSYQFRWEGDTAKNGPTIELYYDRGMLLQRYTPFPDWYSLIQNQPMVRINNAWMYPAIIRDGKIWEMVSDMVFEFKIANGRATSFEIRDDRDNLLGAGARAP